MKKSREFPYLMYFIEENIEKNTNGLEFELIDELKILISFYNKNKKNGKNEIVHMLQKFEEEIDLLQSENFELKKTIEEKNHESENPEYLKKSLLQEKEKFINLREENNFEITKLETEINLLKIDNELNLKKLEQKQFIENELKFEKRKKKELENELKIIKDLIKEKKVNFEKNTKNIKTELLKKKEECEILRKNYKNTYKKKLKYKKYNDNLKNILDSNEKLIKSLKDEKMSYEENSKIFKESLLSDHDLTLDYEKREIFQKNEFLINKKKTLKNNINQSLNFESLIDNENNISIIENNFLFENRKTQKKKKEDDLKINKEIFLKFIKILKTYLKNEKHDLISFSLNNSEEKSLIKNFENLKTKNFQNFLHIIFKPFIHHIFYLESKIQNLTQLNSYYLLKFENIKDERDHILESLKNKDLKSQNILNLNFDKKKKKKTKFTKQFKSEKNIFSNDLFESSIDEHIKMKNNKEKKEDGIWNKMSNFLF